MQLPIVIERTLTMFKQHYERARVILLHPRSRYRSVLVARLINTPDVRALYYAIGSDDVNVQSFINGMTHDVANQHPTFGRHVSMLLPQEAYLASDTPLTEEALRALVTTFAQDLAEVSDTPYLLILDEYDRCDSADDVQRFIELLIEHLPPQCHLVLNSRTLPRLPWVSLVVRKLAVILQDEQLITQDFYGLNSTGDASNGLVVNAFGPGFVMREGQIVQAWEGHLPRLLLFFALEWPVVTRSEVCQAFWPDLDQDAAVNVFHVTKRRLHRALKLDILVHENGYYRINRDLPVQYDVMDMAGLLVAARNEGLPRNERLRLWQRALDLYKGPFLQNHTDGWIRARRHDYRAGYLEAMTSMAAMRLGDGMHEHALTLYKNALAEDPTREDVHRVVMQLYAELGRRSEAAAHFLRLQEDFKQADRALSTQTQQLYSEIMS